jgi:hypothetical protein
MNICLATWKTLKMGAAGDTLSSVPPRGQGPGKVVVDGALHGDTLVLV